MMSGDIFGGDESFKKLQRYYDLGMFGGLAKPCRPEDIIKALRSAILHASNVS